MPSHVIAGSLRPRALAALRAGLLPSVPHVVDLVVGLGVDFVVDLAVGLVVYIVGGMCSKYRDFDFLAKATSTS